MTERKLELQKQSSLHFFLYASGCVILNSSLFIAFFCALKCRQQFGYFCRISTCSCCVVASPLVCFRMIRCSAATTPMINDSLNIWAFVSHVPFQARELSRVQVLPTVACNDLGSWAQIREVLFGVFSALQNMPYFGQASAASYCQILISRWQIKTWWITFS